MSEKKTTTTIKWSNLFAGTPVAVLFWFGLFEGIIAIVQSAEWFMAYTWPPRLLPIAAFALSHIKLFINTEAHGSRQRVVVETDDPNAELTVTKKDIPPSA